MPNRIFRGIAASKAARTRARRAAAVAIAAVAVVSVLAGCALFGGGGGGKPVAAPTHSRTPKPTTTPVAEDRSYATATPTPTPVPVPTLTPVPAGTVVAEASVASPKGSIHFHYRVVSNGDNTYSAQYSNFTSTVPVPVSVTFIDIAPNVGDGLTYHGIGDHLLGGPTSSAAAASTAVLTGAGQPSYLGTLVTYSSAASFDGVPQELGPNKVLAVDKVRWSVPVRPSNVHPVDSGARTNAAGAVTATTASGAPRRYEVAEGDTTQAVADRFGIPVEWLLWLNPDLPGGPGSQYLYASTALNLDPDSL
ncbi:LysM peptidoglycan-binding domain-containing protein [Leifsonia shinshuensis]|uniref:LysM peptidoglycan-binding domain-containing protein n=1 Tax=Leifsonia shinshuensis TaxID=150026 RepID=UPI0021561D14|nr:LysM domain-containing protein [Leifsonia shinshuensis]